MFPMYGSSNPWRSRSQPPPVQRRAGRGPAPAASAAASSSHREPRTDDAEQQPRKAANEDRQHQDQAQEPGQEQPVPAVDERTQRLEELARLAARFQELERNFSPPPANRLVFQPKASATAPKLEYNSTNAPVHGYEEGLTRLLTELDGVESGGDVQVRTTRKALATRVEGEAQRVEKWRREVFEAKRAGAQGPDWQRAEESSTTADAAAATRTPDSVETNQSAAPESRSEEAPVAEADGDGPETPVDEVVYHARDAGRKGASPGKGEQARRPRRSEPAAGSSARGEAGPAPGRPHQQHQASQEHKQRGPTPMCRAEDGDEEDMLTSADERELHAGGRGPASPQARGRHPSAPSQARPHVQQGARSPTHPSARQVPVNQQQQQQQQHPQHAAQARRAPLDPFEALFGGGLGRSAPNSRREAPSSYATYPDRRDGAGEGEGEGEEESEGDGRVAYDDDGIPYRFDARSGSWYPQTQQSRVPWYGHGYPRERDLGGRYQDPTRPPYVAPQQQQRRGGRGYLTPDSDYLFGRGPLGGWGW